MLTEEQLLERRKGIGGSDAGAILGFSPYKTPMDVWLDKTGKVKPDLNKEKKGLYWGSFLEDPIAESFSLQFNRKIQRRNQPIIHKEYPWCRALLDRVIVNDPKGPGALEIKTQHLYAASDWGESGTDEVPEHVMAQLQHQLACTGYQWGVVAVLIGGGDDRYYPIARDEALIEMILDEEGKFWELVQTDTPPEPSNTADMLKRWPQDDGGAIDTTDELTAAIIKVRVMQEKLKAEEEELEATKSLVRRALGSHARLLDANGRQLATWKTQSRTTIDTVALAKDWPDIAKAYERESSTRVFRLGKVKAA